MLTFFLMLLFSGFAAFLAFVMADDVSGALDYGHEADLPTRCVMGLMFPAVLILAVAFVATAGVFSSEAETIRTNVKRFLRVIVSGRDE